MSRLYFAEPAAFTVAECDAVIALAALGGAVAPVYGGAGAVVDSRQRNVWARVHARDLGPEWLFARLDALFERAAAQFELPVGPLREDVQILRYDVGSHFQTWHSDAGVDVQRQRRVSMSVELSERADYEGGELEIVPDRVGSVRTLPRGSAQLFPSRALHRVTPVTRGTRWSLVAWTGE